MQVSGIIFPLNPLEMCNDDNKIQHFSIMLLDPVFSKLNAVYDKSFWLPLLSMDLTESKSVKITGYMAVHVQENEWHEKSASLTFIATQVLFDFHQDANNS
jgi:hypothetical protein